LCEPLVFTIVGVGDAATKPEIGPVASEESPIGLYDLVRFVPVLVHHAVSDRLGGTELAQRLEDARIGSSPGQRGLFGFQHFHHGYRLQISVFGKVLVSFGRRISLENRRMA
jgi:hypothetical protein